MKNTKKTEITFSPTNITLETPINAMWNMFPTLFDSEKQNAYTSPFISIPLKQPVASTTKTVTDKFPIAYFTLNVDDTEKKIVEIASRNTKRFIVVVYGISFSPRPKNFLVYENNFSVAPIVLSTIFRFLIIKISLNLHAALHGSLRERGLKVRVFPSLSSRRYRRTVLYLSLVTRSRAVSTYLTISICSSLNFLCCRILVVPINACTNKYKNGLWMHRIHIAISRDYWIISPRVSRINVTLLIACINA